MKPQHDYSKIDRQMQYNWRQERIEAAQSLGYKFISECIVKEYRKTKSAKRAGAVCGKLTPEAIRMFLNKINEPIGPKGGFRPGDRRWGHEAKARQ